MSRSPPPGTVVPDALDGGKVDELYDKYEIALLEFQGCDELLKTKKIGAEKRKADKQRYRNKLNKAKRAISNLGLDPDKRPTGTPDVTPRLAGDIGLDGGGPMDDAPGSGASSRASSRGNGIDANDVHNVQPVINSDDMIDPDLRQQARVSIGGKSIPESTYVVDGQDFHREQGHSRQATPQDVRMEQAQSTDIRMEYSESSQLTSLSTLTDYPSSPPASPPKDLMRSVPLPANPPVSLPSPPALSLPPASELMPPINVARPMSPRTHSPLPPSSPPTASEETGSESDSASSESDSSSSDDDPVNVTVDVTVSDGTHPLNLDETRSVLDNAEDEEMTTERKRLSKELRVAHNKVLQVKNKLAAVDIAVDNVMASMAASQRAVSDAKQEAQRLLNELGVVKAVEADKIAAFETATVQVKGIDRSQKSVRRQAKLARRLVKAEMDVAADRRATISALSTNATWTFHEREKEGYPLGLEEARVKTQKALLVMELVDAEKVLRLVTKQVDNFNLANANYTITTSATHGPKRPLAQIECESDENDEGDEGRDNDDSGRMDGDYEYEGSGDNEEDEDEEDNEAEDEEDTEEEGEEEEDVEVVLHAPLPPRKKTKLANGRAKASAPAITKSKSQTTARKAPKFSKDLFATQKDYQPALLEAGWDVVVDKLRTVCYKHKANHRTSQVDREHGSLGGSSHRDGTESLVGRFPACGCTIESHILDLLAFKDPAQTAKLVTDGALQSHTAFASGTVDQRKAYIRLLTDVTHSTFRQMLQPEVLRTLDVVFQSLHWLNDLEDAELFCLDDSDDEHVSELRQDIGMMTESMAAWRQNVHRLWKD